MGVAAIDAPVARHFAIDADFNAVGTLAIDQTVGDAGCWIRYGHVVAIEAIYGQRGQQVRIDFQLGADFIVGEFLRLQALIDTLQRRETPSEKAVLHPSVRWRTLLPYFNMECHWILLCFCVIMTYIYNIHPIWGCCIGPCAQPCVAKSPESQLLLART